METRPFQPKLPEIAESEQTPVDRIADFADQFESHPEAVAKLTGELDTLLPFYNYPKRTRAGRTRRSADHTFHGGNLERPILVKSQCIVLEPDPAPL